MDRLGITIAGGRDVRIDQAIRLDGVTVTGIDPSKQGIAIFGGRDVRFPGEQGGDGDGEPSGSEGWA